MIDMEKVIKAVEEAFDLVHSDFIGTDDFNETEWEQNKANALALLRVQVAKPMTEYDDGWDCPRCGIKLVGKTASGYPCDEFDLPNDEIVKYCPVCGQAVKLDD